jgi:hypothetical protein
LPAADGRGQKYFGCSNFCAISRLPMIFPSADVMIDPWAVYGVKIQPTAQITAEYPTTQMTMVTIVTRMLAINDCM